MTRAAGVLLGLLAVSSGAVGAAGCGDPARAEACDADACEVPTQRADLDQQLTGLADPVADWLRASANDDAVIGQDYEGVLAEVGQSLGCDPQQRQTYVVLSNLELAPKAVVSHCSEDPQAASAVLTIFEPNAARDDLDGERFRMAAWDDDAGIYRRYQVAPHPSGGLGVAVEPAFCEGCHGTLAASRAWAPIMNEMTNPWAQWNAEPGFASVLFDETQVEPLAGPTYQSLTQTQLASASKLEPIIRGAIGRVTASVITDRTEEADADLAAALLRPLFCDAAVNFVSESHTSGELDASAVLDPQIRRQFTSVAPSASWEWLRDDTIKLPAAATEADAIRLLAVRAELAIEAEAALVSRGVLRPLDVLRVRALDWTRPVGSKFRCDLFVVGEARLAAEPERWEDAETTGEVVAALFAATMQVSGTSLLQADLIVAVADLEADGVAELVAAGAVDPWIRTVEAWGGELEEHVASMASAEGRSALLAEVETRGCYARRTQPTAPIIPGTTCP